MIACFSVVAVLVLFLLLAKALYFSVQVRARCLRNSSSEHKSGVLVKQVHTGECTGQSLAIEGLRARRNAKACAVALERFRYIHEESANSSPVKGSVPSNPKGVFVLLRGAIIDHDAVSTRLKPFRLFHSLKTWLWCIRHLLPTEVLGYHTPNFP